MICDNSCKERFSNSVCLFQQKLSVSFDKQQQSDLDDSEWMKCTRAPTSCPQERAIKWVFLFAAVYNMYYCCVCVHVIEDVTGENLSYDDKSSRSLRIWHVEPTLELLAIA